MKFVRSFQNDDHFKKSYGIYVCDVLGCTHSDGTQTEKTIEIYDIKRFNKNELIRCSNCGQFSGANKRQQLVDKKKILLEEVTQIDVQIQIIDLTDEQVSLNVSGSSNE